MVKIYHIPVLLKETIDFLKIKKDGIYIDATCGEGGHSFEILKYLGIEGRLICIDRNKEILEIARERLSEFKNVHFYNTSFDRIKDILKDENLSEVDGIIADLGVSMFHLKESSNLKLGISYNDETSLDMRLDEEENIRAYDVVNKFREDEIAKILYEYGEEAEAKRIAKEICRRRPIKNSKELADIIFKVKRERKKNIHPATKSFQALRIFVNKDLKKLESFIHHSVDILSENGRVVVISYHSLEDRIVKQGFKELEKGGMGRVLTKKVIKPSEEEISFNKSARSARMRVFERMKTLEGFDE
ncbi:MAG: 16S rRNA (cytosine(1402)-N(4))-methyltransferase RsmH [Brevinematia bacterium]